MKRLFIVNPLSERVARKGSVLEKLGISEDSIFRLDPFDDLPDAVGKSITDNIEHVIIEGGDGTVQGVVSEFLRHQDKFERFPAFSIIPGGMTNQVAKNIGLPSAKPHQIKARLSDNMKETDIPLLVISEEGGPRYAGFLFSTGAMPQITRYTTGELHRKGIGGSLAVVGGILKGIRGDDADLMQTTDIIMDGIYSGGHLGTIMTTLPGLLLGLDPFWNEGGGTGPLRLTYATQDYRRLGRNILGLWMGRKSVERSIDGLFSGRHDEIAFHYDGPVVLDGEFLSFPSGKFTVHPSRPVTFLR